MKEGLEFDAPPHTALRLADTTECFRSTSWNISSTASGMLLLACWMHASTAAW